MQFRKWLPDIKRRCEHRGLVLMYHRVANIGADPWHLAVRPEIFERQIKILKKNFNVIQTSKLIDQVRNKAITPNSISITFDDGYADNFINACPLLEKYQCPATFFIATQFIDSKKMFWWDELQHIFFETTRLPSVFSMDIAGQHVELSLGDDAVLTPGIIQLQRKWAYYEDPPTRRCSAYYSVWEKLRPLQYDFLESLLTKIRSWAGSYGKRDDLGSPLSSSQLITMGDNPLFELGLHTVSHLMLSAHPWNVQQKEITGSRNCLKRKGIPHKDILTYPYGEYDITTRRIVGSEGIDGAFTTHPQVITNCSDIYSLGRFHVKNWSNDDFELNIRNWLRRS